MTAVTKKADAYKNWRVLQDFFFFVTIIVSLVLKNPAEIYIYTCKCRCVPVRMRMHIRIHIVLIDIPGPW